LSQPLSKKKIDELSQLLSPEQKVFMKARTKQSKKSKWVESLACMKGIALDEKLSFEEMEQQIDDWILLDILDSGFGSKDYRCECGRPLRYQYIVQHKKEGKSYGLGSKCFELHTSLPANVVKDILDGFLKVDLERDEILLALRRNDIFDLSPYMITGTIPSEYIEQFLLGLPLTKKQQIKVYELWEEFKEKSKLETALATLNSVQKELYEVLNVKEQEELIQKLANDNDYYMASELYDVPKDTMGGEIYSFVDADLPLLNKHLKEIRERRYELQRSLKSSFRVITVEPTPNHLQQQKTNWITDDTVDVHKLLERHLPTLKKIREKEENIPYGLKKDWAYIQELVRKGKNGEAIDYSSFKVNLMNLCFALHISY
jgi:hypothetical protein